MNILVFSLIFLLVLFVFFVLIKILFVYLKKKHSEKKSEEMGFLLVKIPRKDSEGDQKGEQIQSMNQNLEIMNQIYKNLSSLYSDSFLDRWLCESYVSLEMVVEKEIIKFIVGVPKDHIDGFEKLISSFYSGSIIDRIEQPKFLEAGKYSSGGYFMLSKSNALPLKTYENFEADPMDSILSAFSRVGRDEKASIQLLVSPMSENWQKELRSKIEDIKNGSSGGGIFKKIGSFISGFLESVDENDSSQGSGESSGYSSGQEQDMEKKAEDEGFDCLIKALAVSPSPDGADKIMKDIKRSFSQYNYVGLNNFSFVEPRDNNEFLKDFVKRTFNYPNNFFKDIFSFSKNNILNVKELSSLYHFPHFQFNKNPRIKWQKFKIIPAPDDIPEEGILLGTNSFSGVERQIRLGWQDRFRHFYTIGQTGTGKSTMLTLQAKQDLQNGNGFTLIDPHGDLAEDVLRFCPKERVDDLIYIDVGDFDYPVGINMFEGETDLEKDLIVNDAVDMFTMMYGPEIFGPRLVDPFRNAALALMEQPEGGTLAEIVRMFTDEAFQKVKLKNVKNPSVRSWFEKTYASFGEREKSEFIPFFQAKFSPFTTTPIMKNIIGQPTSSFSFHEAMQSNKIIILNLSKGKMGETNSKLLGTMVTSKLKAAALKRANMPEKDRVGHILYIDEFQNYVTPSIETILSEARKYRLGLVLAHQYIDQLEQSNLGGNTDLKGPIFGNVGSMLSYKVSAEDAEKLEPQFSPEFSRSDLVNMDKYKGVMKLSIDTQPSKPFSISVKNPFEDGVLNDDEKVKVIKEISRLKYGRKRELVEKEVNYRVGA